MEVTSIPTVHFVRTDKDSHFTGALATNAIELENVTGLKSPAFNIESVTLQSDQNLDWDIYVWATDGHSDTDVDLDYFLGKITFVAADGKQIAGAGQYYYDTSSCSQPFRPFPAYDRDAVAPGAGGKYELHTGLVNRSATSKNAGATGEVSVTFGLRYDEQTPLTQS